MNITLPKLAWHGNKRLTLSLPDKWQVELCNMTGYDQPSIVPEAIAAALRNPIGAPPIRELARGRKEVVIIFDDISRVTRTAGIVSFLLEELSAAGIPDSNIRFICALGCHGAMNRFDFVNKLGETILSRFAVYNHNPFANCIYVGTTSWGTRVYINEEVMRCDLKIGIGSIVPHIMAGFGGGGKILMPGVASFDTIESFHVMESKIREENPGKKLTGMGVYEGNPLRLNMEEVAIMAGLDIKIDCLVNMWGETTTLFVGEPKAAYAAGIEAAKKHYLTPRAMGKDIVIANTFSKVTESESGLITAMPVVKQQGGDIVLISHAPEGHAVHYLMGPFGKFTGGRQRMQIQISPNINNLIIFNEYPDISGIGYFASTDRIRLMSKWDDVLSLLMEHYGDKAQVAIFPNAEMQYCV